MYVTNGQEDVRKSEILSLMPSSLRTHMYRINFCEAFEIRMSIGRALMVYYPDGCYYLSSAGYLTKSPQGAIKVSRSHIDEALEIATKSSLYTSQQSICRGFITAGSGHRIGICGSGVYEKDSLVFLRDISTLTYRLAIEKKGIAKKLFDNVYANGDTKNTLIISPPCCGKTTMLRDLVRLLSGEGLRICVVDERGEIAAMAEGKSPFDIGDSTDVLSLIPKANAMEMALRSLSPQVVACDELGSVADALGVKNCIAGGAKVICTAHAKSTDEVRLRSGVSECFDMFDLFAVLARDTKTGEFTYTIIHREEL